MRRQTLLVAACFASAIFCMALVGFLVLGESRRARTDELARALDAVDLRLDRLESRIESRIDELQREIRPWPAPPLESGGDPSAARPADAAPAETGTPTESAGDGVGRVLARLDDLEMRVRGLEEDPVQRGFTFLESQNAELRRQGIFTLERIARHDPQALAAIRQMLQDPDAETRLAALDTLADIEDKDSAALVGALLADSNPRVRIEAVETLARIGARDAGAGIAQLLSDPEAGVRQRAADALGRLRSPEGTGLLLQALGDGNEEVRGEAIASLGEVGAKEAVPALLQLYAKDPGRHRFRVVQALRALGDTSAFEAEVSRMSQAALQSENEGARRDAIRTLAWFARNEARDVFEKARNDPSERVRREAEQALRGERRQN